MTLFGSWIAARTEGFLLTWALGVLSVVGNVFFYGSYIQSPSPALLAAAYLSLVLGLAVLVGAAHQFRTGRSPLWRIVIGTGLAVIAAIPAMLLGLTGLVFIIWNIAATLLLFATAREYWLGRSEAPGPITALVVLYSITAVSFAFCAGVLIVDGHMVIAGAPDNWAETLNLAVCIASLSGIGALSMALNQWRLARRHRTEATTDSMTGLLNRRALFEQYGAVRFTPAMAVILFDLDGFKAVNDRYGHATGDAVLKVFAAELSGNCRPADIAARFGGEEFAMVINRTLPEWAERIAERIRTNFAGREIMTDHGGLFCTVSAGMAFGSESGMTLDAMLSAADKALYTAKAEGRNRIATAGYLRAV